MNKKIKYKKIAEDKFEQISETEEVVGIIKLKQIKETKDYYFNKHKEMEDLYKHLKELKAVK